ncbi:MAG: cytochrome c3 family protein [Bryobacterales bacterium]|nr:cytochrome c3 family protein [Bryobacterales bacterium]
MMWLVLLLGLALQGQETAKVCAACHTDPFEELQTHKHFAKSVFCDTCHGASEQHRNAVGATPPDKVAAPEHQPGLCGTCHPGQRKSYEASKHGVLVMAKSKTRAASCGTCHGVHSARTAAAMLRQCERCHASLPASCKKETAEVGKLACAGCHEPHGLARRP